MFFLKIIAHAHSAGPGILGQGPLGSFLGPFFDVLGVSWRCPGEAQRGPGEALEASRNPLKRLVGQGGASRGLWDALGRLLGRSWHQKQ